MLLEEIIEVKDFRGIASLKGLKLNPQLNVFVGDNGSGKTTMLEALLVAVGSLFIGMKDEAAKAQGIDKGDARLAPHQERMYPVAIEVIGQVNGEVLTWRRELLRDSGSTTTKNASNLKQLSQRLDSAVRENKPVLLPLIAYFSTRRLFDEKQLRDGGGALVSEKQAGSRFRGYIDCLDAKSNFKTFLRWFRAKELSQLQKKEEDASLAVVKAVIIDTLPGCADLFYDVDPDTERELTVVFTDGRVLPFVHLSDGMRGFVALMADLAYRCLMLNGRFCGKEVLAETSGVVLIDELDLHLHPSWQKIVLDSLLKTFPKVQFIVATHSPFLIQETSPDQLIMLKDCKVVQKSGGVNMSIEDIAEDVQGLSMAQWSRKRKIMFDTAKRYYAAKEKGEVPQELEDQFFEDMKPFANDTAYHAILEQRRLVREYKRQQS